MDAPELAARDREITRILGTHLMHEIEAAVRRLAELSLKIHSVEHTVSGIFLVDSEVMFIPTNELIRCVNTLFEGLGNPHLAREIDGVTLLAARNLLIEVVAFFSYYGKHQIYNLVSRHRGRNTTVAITYRIRSEIRKLFEACKRDNKLVLTRVVENAERDFELSVEAIQQEAEASAVAAVIRILPPEAPPRVAAPRSWMRRVLGRLGFGRAAG